MSSSSEPTLDSLIRQVREYAETRAELLKLTAVARASEFTSTLAGRLAVYLLASRMILLLSIGIAFLLGEWIGRYSIGFLLVSVAFALAGIAVHFWRDKWIVDPVARGFITKILE